MKRPLLSATASLALALSLPACGSVSGIDDLFSGGSGAGGAAATTSGQGVTTGGSGGTDTTTTSGPTTTSTGGSTTTGSTATSSSAVTSSATGPGSTASASASSSSGGPMNTVFCNSGECAVGEICCFNLSQQTDHCGQPGSCGDGYIDLECNGPEDCPGGVCCADVDFQNNPPYKGIACEQSCNNPQSNLIMCSDADPTCPGGQQCQQSMVLGMGYKFCN